ncbi:MAG: hypothetical protein JWR21_3409 [Herminiimonas sp.]|nr:hypothetical protein [Herminiimonas sp.]
MATLQRRETVDGWLAEMSKDGEPLVLDESGRCLIVADEQVGLALCVPPESGRFFLYADVLAVPHSQRRNFMKKYSRRTPCQRSLLG